MHIKRVFAKLMLIFLLTKGYNVFGQKSLINIIEVYWDNDTIETFDYKIAIISKGDTINPTVKDKYYLPVLQLDTFVNLTIEIRDKKISLPRLDSYFLSGYSYIKIRISSTAENSCTKETFSAFDTIDRMMPNFHCHLFHDFDFKRYRKSDFDHFYRGWRQRKKVDK